MSRKQRRKEMKKEQKKSAPKHKMAKALLDYSLMNTHRHDNIHVTTGAPNLIKEWTVGVPVEESARKQLFNIAHLPFIYKHIAVMPDVHLGKGATVGSVIATTKAVIPAAVGVDLGCGMMALRTTLTASHLPDNLYKLRSEIESMVPHGRTDNGGANDKGAWVKKDPPSTIQAAWLGLESRYKKICDKHPKIFHRMNFRHLGSLGTGNHFIELCLDENKSVWIMLHSGSRGPGNAVGSYFIEKAKEDMRRYYISLPDDDLAYLPEGTDHFDDYVEAVDWAQDFARVNRELMMEQVLKAMRRSGLPKFETVEEAVNCHHNYISKEFHGQNVWVTRKGAVNAREGQLGIIPGSMGARSYIVRGKGNAESFNSCSHGAGRVMSRGEARKRITLTEHKKATEGVECRKDDDVIDESPAAYKDIDQVMAAQSDLVDVVHTLKQVLCVKG